jgi:hypothetical protein
VSERGANSTPANASSPVPSSAEGAVAERRPRITLNDLDASEIQDLADSIGLTHETLERLQSLRDQVHQTLDEEFSVVADDLVQLRMLLSDAAAKLSGTFRTVTASSEAMRTTIAGVQGTPDMQVLQRINQIATEMTSTTGQTIQSLQFEDMATQLLQHVDRKLTVISRLAKDMAVINPTASSVPPLIRIDQFDELFARLESYRTELKVATRKVVQQQSLDSGDIELF